MSGDWADNIYLYDGNNNCLSINSIDNGSGTLFEGFIADGGSRKAIPFRNGDWVYLNTSTSSFTKMSIESVKLIWSNFDILNEDGSVYFAASEPISLDGMNVIEWDGDTIGLEMFPGKNAGYYRISSATNIDVAQNILTE